MRRPVAGEIPICDASVDLRFLSLSIPALSSPADADSGEKGGEAKAHTAQHLPPIKQRMGNEKDAASAADADDATCWNLPPEECCFRFGGI